MRNFADVVRLPEPHKKMIDLHQLVYTVSKLMEVRAGEAHTIQISCCRLTVFISVGTQQIDQVLINVAKNVTEAMEENGVVSFETDLQKRRLVITDTGKGFCVRLLRNLFTPFFSTKKDGQGIGLTSVREILINHRFEFSLRTVAAEKTEFAIRFKKKLIFHSAFKFFPC